MTQRFATDISAVIGEVYEAAYDQTRWRDAMARLCTLFDGSRACICRTDGGENVAIGSYEDNFEQADWRTQDIQLLATGMRSMKVGRTYIRRQIVDEAQFRQSLLWQQHFRPRQMDDSLSCNLRLDGKSIWVVDVSRASRQGVFEDTDMEIMRRIIPHVFRAGQIAEKLQNVSIYSSLYDTLPFGMAIIDGGLRISHTNRAAEALLARADVPLRVRNGRLTGVNAELGRIIVNACTDDAESLPSTGGNVILFARNSAPEGPNLLVSVAPLAATMSYGILSGRSAALMFREIGQKLNGNLMHYQLNMFGFSPAEARLAAGHSITAIAAAQGIQVKTARSYLENVFRKTGTHRQGELIALLKTAQPIIQHGEF